MTIGNMRAFLNNFGIMPGMVMTLAQLDIVIRTAKRWFGEPFSAWLQDCFAPEGMPVSPGYEDSLSHYRFCFDTWEELEREFDYSGDVFAAM